MITSVNGITTATIATTTFNIEPIKNTIHVLFPRLAIWASYLTGVQSPANCVFMLIIFTLGCHQFFLSIKVSQLTIKNSELIQDIAIYRTLEGEEKRANGEENS